MEYSHPVKLLKLLLSWWLQSFQMGPEKMEYLILWQSLQKDPKVAKKMRTYSLMCHDNLLIFLPIFSAQDKNSLSILSCHFLSIKKIRKKLLNIFRNLFLQYISCTVIWILNFKNCSKLIAKCWRHVRSIYYPKPRSKNHPWINV